MSRLIAPTFTVEEYERAADEYYRALPLEHFMEARDQSTQREITLESLALLRARRADVQVFNEMVIQYPWEDQVRQVVPDNMIVLGEEPSRAEGSFNLEHEPAAPLVVMEYVSRRRKRKDYVANMQKYEQELRVPYYLTFDPESQDLRLRRLDGEHYKLVPPNSQGRHVIQELDLEVGLLDGWVRFWHQGHFLELPDALQARAEREKQRAEQEKQRADQEKQRADQEKQRADQEKQRADQEKQRAEKSEQRETALAAEIKRLQSLLKQEQDCEE